MNAITYRLATRDDAKACVGFHNQNYARKISEEQWQWQLFSSAAPNELHCNILAELDGCIVGTQSIMPMQFIDPSGVYWSSKAEQTLVSPEKRGCGVFADMYDEVFRHCDKYRITNIWASTPAGKAYERVGFNIPFTDRDEWKLTLSPNKTKPMTSPRQLAKWVRDSAKSLRNRIKRNRAKRIFAAAETSAQEVTFEYWDDISEEIETLTRRFITQWKGATIYRTAPFLTWRLKNNPFVKTSVVGAYSNGELVGYAAFALDQSNASSSLVDIMAIDGIGIDAASITSRLLHFCIDEIEKHGAASIDCWCDDKHPYNAQILPILRQIGFQKRTVSTSVVLYVSPNAHKFCSAPPALYDDYSEWFVTMLFQQGHRG